MQLDEYIKETLIQITKGVKDASEVVSELGGEVNPAREVTEYQSGYEPTSFRELKSKGKPSDQIVKFDIALQVRESHAADGSGKAKLAVISIGGGVKSVDETNSAHRVQFEVPLSLPSNLS